MTQVLVDEARPVNPECDTCSGTGFDLDFGGRCSECWGHAPRQGGMGETLREHRNGGIGGFVVEDRPRKDDSWKQQIRWTKNGDTFFVLIPRGHGKVTEGDVVTVTSRNGEKQVRLGVCFAPNQYGDLLYWPLRDGDTTGAATLGLAPVAVTTAPARPNRYGGTCVRCGGEVEAEAGTCEKRDGRWVVSHIGECPERVEHAVPAGHYAIASEGDNDLLFVRVDRNEGYPVRVKMIVGGHPEMTLAKNRVTGILARIAEAGVAEAAKLYGNEIGRCCRCNRTLTDATSRAAGIGPECATKG